jgi:hypothetical protein
MNFNHNVRKSVAFAVVFGASMLIGASATVNAQSHEKQEKRDLKQHQRQERAYYGNNHQTKDHQRMERDRLKYEQRAEHNGNAVGHGQYNNNGYGNGTYNNDGYYRNNQGYDPYYSNGRSNNGYYGNDPYYNNGRSNSGYYGNDGSYGNRQNNQRHRDSRNPIRRAIHHARGGH